jgi:hypothetical protein
MNVTSLVNDRYIEMENRKRALRQKTADDAYRKNAQYFKPKFNPALEELVDLLTGKKKKSINLKFKRLFAIYNKGKIM